MLFEIERVRLLEVVMEPGSSTEMHSHPDNLAYLLSDGKYAFTAPSRERAEFDVAPGGVFWMEATDHATENLGGTTIHALMFEPK